MISVIMKSDIRNLDLNLLRTLDALLDECNVTKAAQRLALTQPAVSGMLTRLRATFGDPLFIRTQRGILPTDRALELAGPVKQVLSDIESMLRPPVFEPASAQMTLAMAATDYALQVIVVPFLSRLSEAAPGIRVAVVPVRNQTLHAQLERGGLDLALVTPETASTDLHMRTLFHETYVCVMRDDHPAAKPGALTLERFCALDHALVSYDGGVFHGVTDDALEGLGRSRRVALSVTSFLVLPRILRGSDLIAVVPRRLIDPGDGLAIVEVPVNVPGFSKTLAWHERTHRSPGHQWIREILFDVSSSAVSPGG
jgi:DNA-binding transcriptional LysR family regulator